MSEWFWHSLHSEERDSAGLEQFRILSSDLFKSETIKQLWAADQLRLIENRIEANFGYGWKRWIGSSENDAG